MDITIEKLIYGGDGLAHHDGSTVFVPFVLPAERVAAEPVESKKKFVRARVETLIEPSPSRVAARCPHFGVCGGCHYQHIPYDAQLQFKSEILRETLRRIGRVEWPGTITAHASPPWGYRNRAQWKVRRLDDSSTKLGIGYFRAHSTAFCSVEDCAILSPLLLEALLALREAGAAGELPRQLREVEAFAGPGSSQLLLTMTCVGFPSGTSALAEKLRQVLPALGSLLIHEPERDRMELHGPGFVECEVDGMKYRVGHFSFFQVNNFLVPELVAEVAGREEPGRTAFDLFAGVGLFSKSLAKRFERIVAVESNPAAARDFESNVLAPGGENKATVEMRVADVERFLEKCKERPQLVVLDPPRAGLSPGAVARLARLAPARITYVACEPPALARDLAGLLAAGYELSEVHLFDLFPQTFHMETVVRLRRRS